MGTVRHEQIWAPWRLSYIQSVKDQAEQNALELLPGADRRCFLCQVSADSDDRRGGVVFRTANCVALLNRYPYNNGHLLVAPQRHLARPDDIEPAVHHELSDAVNRLVGLLEKTLHPQGFNVGLNLGLAAGAGVPGHLHWHIVPRWNGDTNFMPVLGGVNVIPQSLEALWETLTQQVRGGNGL